MGGDEDRDAAVGRLVDELPELAARGGVHPTRRLIQEDNLRLVEDGHGEGQLLFPAQGQAAHARVALRLQPDASQHLVGARSDIGLLHAVNACKEADVLPHFQVFVERELLTHVADVALHLFGLPLHVETGHCGSSARRSAQAREHAHGGGLPRPVGTQETEDFAPPHIERDVVHGHERAELLRQPLYLDNRTVGMPSLVVTEARRTENVGKARQDAVWRINAVHLSPIKESDTVALPRLVHDGGGDNDGDALLLQAAEHVPQFPT